MFLKYFSLNPRIAQWFSDNIIDTQEDTQQQHDEMVAKLEARVTTIKRQISNLTDLRIRELLDDNEFNNKRQALELELGAAEENRNKAAKSIPTFEPIHILEKLCTVAIFWYQQLDNQNKQRLLKILCSNPSLKDKKALLKAKKPFTELHGILSCLDMRGDRDNVRTTHSNAHDAQLKLSARKTKQIMNKTKKLAADPETIELAKEVESFLKSTDILF